MHPQTALITGASSGIGRALAHLFARDGYGLVLVGRQRESLEAVRQEIALVSHTPVFCLTADLASPGEGPTLVADARLIRGERAPAPARAARAESDPWWKSRWMWVGVGGAALSAVAAGLLIGAAGDQDASWSPSVDPCEFGGC